MELVTHIVFLLMFSFGAFKVFKLFSSIRQAKRERELISLEKYYYYFYPLLILVLTLIALNNFFLAGIILLN